MSRSAFNSFSHPRTSLLRPSLFRCKPSSLWNPDNGSYRAMRPHMVLLTILKKNAPGPLEALLTISPNLFANLLYLPTASGANSSPLTLGNMLDTTMYTPGRVSDTSCTSSLTWCKIDVMKRGLGISMVCGTKSLCPTWMYTTSGPNRRIDLSLFLYSPLIAGIFRPLRMDMTCTPLSIDSIARPNPRPCESLISRSRILVENSIM